MTALSSVFPQSWRRLIILLPIAITTLVLAAALLNGPLPRPRLPKVVFPEQPPPTPVPPHRDFSEPPEPAHLDDIPTLIRALWAPTRLSITTPNFTTLDGTIKSLPPPNELIHTQPLGKRICILDVDNRPLNEPGDIFAPTPPTADNLIPRSAGFLSHYLYAQIHNYTYKFVRSPKYLDRAPHWSKVIFTQQVLKQFDIVVMLDYDAMFPSPELPLEWLLNYWKVDRDVLVAMAEDPDADFNRDLRRKLNVNTGFIIAQASDRTQRLFKDWAECPEETRYKECAQWKEKAFHEQAAFSSHVRYDFLEGMSVEDPAHQRFIRTLPCNEANGVPKTKDAGCVGQMVRHYWAHKPDTKLEFTHNLMNVLVPLLSRAAYRDPEVVVDYRGKVLKGDQILDGEVPAAP